MRWEEYELRECSTGGGVATRLAPADSFHLTGYPGDLKFPGRSAQYLPIFLLVALRPAFVCSFVWENLLRQLLLGTENGGTPALLLPDDKGRSGGGEQPGRWSPGGWRSEGGSRFFFKEARKDWIFSSFQPAFNLATRAFCSVKQTLEVDSWWKWKCSSGPGWVEDSLGDIFIVPTSSLSLFCC